MAEWEPPRKIDPGDAAVLKGYKIEPATTGFTFPTGITFVTRRENPV